MKTAKLYEITRRDVDVRLGRRVPVFWTGELFREGDIHDCFIFAIKKWPKGGPRDTCYKGRFIHSGPPDYKTVALLEIV